MMVLVARPDVAQIEEQPPAFDYLDENGRQASHMFDFLVTSTNGERIAVAVKQSAVAAAAGLGLLGPRCSQIS
jgi:hypothetical protein